MTLLDTTPLVALADPREASHARARTHLAHLAGGGLCTCEAVIVEACFHLPHPSQRQRLRGILEDFNIAPVTGTDAREFWTDVLDWLLKYAEHEPDWADGCIAVLSGRSDRLKVWTYDREFRTTWRRPDGTAIPMAVT